MSDWNKPTTGSKYDTEFIPEVTGRDEDLATMFDVGSPTNIPTNTVRWNDANSRWEKWNGSSWVLLKSLYLITVDESDKVDGIHASATPQANKLLALDSNAKLPASITGDAHTVDGMHASDLVPKKHTSSVDLIFGPATTVYSIFTLTENAIGGTPIGLRIDSAEKVSGQNAALDTATFGFTDVDTNPEMTLNVKNTTNKGLSGSVESYTASEREISLTAMMTMTGSVTGTYRLNYTIFYVTD